jgi:hypothetical protein
MSHVTLSNRVSIVVTQPPFAHLQNKRYSSLHRQGPRLQSSKLCHTKQTHASPTPRTSKTLIKSESRRQVYYIYRKNLHYRCKGAEKRHIGPSTRYRLPSDGPTSTHLFCLAQAKVRFALGFVYLFGVFRTSAGK